MEGNLKIELNKKIRNYEGDNVFLLSLKKYLSSKYPKKEEINGRFFKILSEKQYQSAISLLDK